MGLLKKLFGGDGESASKPASSHFHESESAANRSNPENAPRRELVQVVLRDTMRKHGIPSDWLECRILSVVTRRRKTGMHVQLIVKQGGERLVQYVHPFQQTFWAELGRFEAKPREWLLSLAWQFDSDAHHPDGGFSAQGWDEDDTQPPDAQDTQPPEEDPEMLASDLQALYAIRDAALSEPASLTELPPAPPGKNRSS